MGTLSGSTTIQTGTETFNLSTPAQTDWIEFPQSATSPNRKLGGGLTIGLPTLIGSGVSWGGFAFGYKYTWADGTPMAAGTNRAEGIYVSASTSAAGQGFQFTLPADTAQRTVTIYWGGNSCASQLDFTLSDGSAAALQHLPTAPGSGASQYLSTTLTYSANSAGQTLTCKLTAKTIIGGSGNVWMGAAEYLVAAVVSTGTVGIAQAKNAVASSGGALASGSAAPFQRVNTLVATGGATVTGVGALAEGKAFLVASGGATATGSGAISQNKNAIASSGSVTVSGESDIVQQPDVVSASGVSNGTATGSVSITQAKNGIASAGSTVASGSAAVTQDGDVVAASGGALATGSSPITQAKNVAQASGVVASSGSAELVQAPNAIDGEAVRGDIRVGSFAIEQEANALLASGGVVVSGLAPVVAAKSASVSSGSVVASGSGALTASKSVVTSTGSSTASGSGALVQDVSLLDVDGGAQADGSVAVAQKSSSIVAAGLVFTGISGEAALTQAADTVMASGSVSAAPTPAGRTLNIKAQNTVLDIDPANTTYNVLRPKRVYECT